MLALKINSITCSFLAELCTAPLGYVPLLDPVNAPVTLYVEMMPPALNPPLMFGPNISGADSPYGLEASNKNTVLSGAFFLSDSVQATKGYGHTEAGKDRAVFMSADRSSTIYGGASTVQPPAVRFLPVIKF